MEADDGAFWMSWQDFVHNFDEMYVCRFYDQHTFPCQGALEGKWDSGTAGGCCNYPTVERNMQLAVSAMDDSSQQQGDIELVVELIQADSRGSGKELPIVILELYDNDGRPVTQHQRGRLVANKGNNTLAVHIQLTLTRQQAQRTLHTPLTLLPCTYQPDTLTSYTLRWFASSTVHVQRFGGDGQSADSNQDSSQHQVSSDAVQQRVAAQATSEQRVGGSVSSPDTSAMQVSATSRAPEPTETVEEASVHRSSFTLVASRSTSPTARKQHVKPHIQPARKQRMEPHSHSPPAQRAVREQAGSQPGQTHDFEL